MPVSRLALLLSSFTDSEPPRPTPFRRFSCWVALIFLVIYAALINQEAFAESPPAVHCTLIAVLK